MWNKLYYIMRYLVKKTGMRKFMLLYHPRALFYRYSYAINKNKYQSVADPEKIIWIAINDVKRKIPNEKVSQIYFKRKMPGRWDLRTSSIYDEKYVSVFQHFDAGIPWKDTPLFQHYEKRLAREYTVLDCQTVDELVKKYEENMNALYFSMKEDGFLLPSKNNPSIDMIQVYIDRKGDILFPSNGKHRYALAKILQMTTIPVQVKGRHIHWQKAREKMHQQTKEERQNESLFLLHHPDLQDIVFKTM